LQPAKTGLIKAYAATAPQRLKVAPDLPTIAESRPFAAETANFPPNLRQNGRMTSSLVIEPRGLQVRHAVQIGGGPAVFRRAPLQRSAGL